MTIGLSDTKILWGRAGGRCSNPACRADLTKTIERSLSFHIGEMAHIIAQSPDGPRALGSAGADIYDNLVLLCPTCHTMIDKAPNAFSEEQLRNWKVGREGEVEEAGREVSFSSHDQLKRYVGLLLSENRQIFETVGPRSNIAQSDPGSDSVNIWEARKLDTLLPNNYKIINALNSNIELTSDGELRAFAAFRQHASAYEQQQYGRTDFYPLFPEEFGRLFDL
jgi:hypothetical protein